jgi:hypothetical protein
LFVFDQDRGGWFEWDGDASKWVERSGSQEPVITHVHFSGTGTRTVNEAAEKAIAGLFRRSFGG